MERALRDLAGGIEGLLSHSREEWDALEADMAAAGWTLSDVPGRVSWRAVIQMFRHARAGSALFRAVHGDSAVYSQETHAIVTLTETIEEFMWLFRTSKIDPRKQAVPPRPKKHPRPGIDVVDPDAGEKLTGKPMDKADWAEFWATGIRPDLNDEDD